MKLLGSIVGRADRAHLPLADELLQRAQGFLDRRARIRKVREVDVDPVGAQSLQRGLRGFEDVLAAEARAAGAHLGTDFGDDHDLVPPRRRSGEPLADNRFRLAAAMPRYLARVHVGRIDGVESGRDEVARSPVQPKTLPPRTSGVMWIPMRPSGRLSMSDLPLLQPMQHWARGRHFACPGTASSMRAGVV